MIAIITFIISLLTFGAVEFADITYTYVDEYSYETQDGITLAQLFGDQPIYEKPNLFDYDNANILEGYIDINKFDLYSATRSIYIEIEPNTTYTISRITDGTKFKIGTYETTPIDELGTIDYYDGSYTELVTFTSANNANYMAVYFYHSGTDTLTIEELYQDIQIEEGSFATGYTEYGEYKTVDNIIVNGTFDTDTSWTKDISWTIGDGIASYDYSATENIRQGTSIHGFTFVNGDTYLFCIDLLNDGRFGIYAGNHIFTVDDKTAGTYCKASSNITSSTVQVYGYTTGTQAFDIDNIRVYDLGSIYGYGNEPTISEIDTWYGLYETAITTDQHEYTYTLNTLEREDVVLIIFSASLWAFGLVIIKEVLL